MKSRIVLILSLMPLLVLTTIFLTEAPFRLSSESPKDLAEIFSWFRIGSALLVISMMLYFIGYILHSEDQELRSKRALWIFILLFANVFALPIFWFLHYRRCAKVHNQQV